MRLKPFEQGIASVQIVHRINQLVEATDGVYKGQGRN